MKTMQKEIRNKMKKTKDEKGERRRHCGEYNMCISKTFNHNSMKMEEKTAEYYCKILTPYKSGIISLEDRL